MRQSKMRIIGVTGGIGSGKSTVSRILEGMGAAVIDADQIAKEIVAKGQPALKELVLHFGGGILGTDCELDRKKLASIVFNHKENLNVLNTITHKYVVERILSDIEAIRNKAEAEFIVLDVPIPVEHGFLDTVDEVWAVTADADVRVRRVMERSGMAREEILRRINSQMNEQEYRRISDRIICNNGSMEQLEDQVKRAFSNKQGGGIDQTVLP